MKVELFPIYEQELYYPATREFGYRKIPRVMVSLHRARWFDRFWFKVGRLYVGYVGVMLTTRWFTFDLWIHKWER